MGQLIREEGRWRYRETVVAGTTSAPLRLPVYDDRQPAATVAVYPASGGSGLIEYTLAPWSDVQAAAPSVVWLSWPAESVTVNTGDIVEGPATALRCTATGGDVDWEVLA